jgi:SOS-response transcriptional repressor LexA
LILQLTPHADLGDLVVVRTPDGNTVKYLFPLDDDCVILRGANALYEDQIWNKDDIRIIAVVRRVERDLAGKRRGDIR